MAQPSDNEIKINNDLIEELKKQGSFESHEETQKRSVGLHPFFVFFGKMRAKLTLRNRGKVLGELQKITEEFVRQVYISKNQSDMVVKAAGGKVFTYGSYRLGVFGPGTLPSAARQMKGGRRRRRRDSRQEGQQLIHSFRIRH